MTLLHIFLIGASLILIFGLVIYIQYKHLAKVQQANTYELNALAPPKRKPISFIELGIVPILLAFVLIYGNYTYDAVESSKNSALAINQLKVNELEQSIDSKENAIASLEKDKSFLKKTNNKLRRLNEGGLIPALKAFAKSNCADEKDGKNAIALLKTYLYEVDLITAVDFYEDRYFIDKWDEHIYVEGQLLSSYWTIVVEDRMKDTLHAKDGSFNFCFDIGVDARTKYDIDITASVNPFSSSGPERNYYPIINYLNALGETQKETLFGLSLPLAIGDFDHEGKAVIKIMMNKVYQSVSDYSLYGTDVSRFKKGIRHMDIYLHFASPLKEIVEPKYDQYSGSIIIPENATAENMSFKSEKWINAIWGIETINAKTIPEQYVYHASIHNPVDPIFFYFEQAP